MALHHLFVAADRVGPRQGARVAHRYRAQEELLPGKVLTHSKATGLWMTTIRVASKYNVDDALEAGPFGAASTIISL